MASAPVITEYGDLYDVLPLLDEQILVKSGSGVVARDLTAVGRTDFAALDDVVAGAGLWTRQLDGSFVWTDPASFDTAGSAAAALTTAIGAAAGLALALGG